MSLTPSFTSIPVALTLALACFIAERFGVRVISEFFASSEGNGSLFNYNSNALGAGAVGQEGLLATLARRKKQTIVKVDELTEEPARDANGFCTRVCTGATTATTGFELRQSLSGFPRLLRTRTASSCVRLIWIRPSKRLLGTMATRPARTRRSCTMCSKR